MKRDLFAILLKINERISQPTFQEFQRTMMAKNDVDMCDLLYQAQKYDWPLLAVLAAMTKNYRWKNCWIVWLIGSCDFEWKEKFKTLNELAQQVTVYCVEKGFVQALDSSLSIFYPESSMKTLSKFLLMSKKGTFEGMKELLKQFIVKFSENDYNLVAAKGKLESMSFTITCILKNLQVNFQSVLHQEQYLDVISTSGISQFSSKVDFTFLKRMCKILERTNMRIDFEDFYDLDNSQHNVEKICESLINDHQFEAAIEIADLLSLPKSDFVSKWWIHMWMCEDKNSRSFDSKKYMKYVTRYNISMEIMQSFVKTVIKDAEPSVKKFNMMKFLLRNNWSENTADLDQLEYDTILLYLKLKSENNASDLEPLMSEYYESVISKDKSIIYNSLYELKAIAKVDELTISHKMLQNAKELNELDGLIFQHLDAGDIVQVFRIQEMFGRAPEDLKLLVYMFSIAENITSIYDIAKEERKMISSFGLMSNKFNRLTLRSLRTSSSSKLTC